MKKIIKVLSIDGGGIRGIIPAMILADLEARTGKEISDLFDLVVGTSTGGILTLGLNVPKEKGSRFAKYSAKDMVSFYENEGSTIFRKNLFREAYTLRGLLRQKYPSADIEKIFDKYFGDISLKDSLSEVLITAYEIERRISWFFKSTKAHHLPNYDFLMKDIARSTSAAPTYFPPTNIIPSDERESFTLVDGGVFANNPAMCGYVEAITQNPDADGFLIVSLGTGEQTERIPYNKARNWGLAHWAQPMLGVVFDGVSDTVDYQLKHILKPIDRIPMYYRFQVMLSGVNEDLDDASPANIRNLKLLAEDLIRERRNELDLLCEELIMFKK